MIVFTLALRKYIKEDIKNFGFAIRRMIDGRHATSSPVAWKTSVYFDIYTTMVDTVLYSIEAKTARCSPYNMAKLHAMLFKRRRRAGLISPALSWAWSDPLAP